MNPYRFGFHDKIKYVFKAEKGLSKRLIHEISFRKNEPSWIKDFRLKSFIVFQKTVLPSFGPDLSKIDFNNFSYYAQPIGKKVKSWKELPSPIKKTYDFLGIPSAERNFLAGAEVMYDSQNIYGSLKNYFKIKGVIFCDIDTAIKEYPDLVKKYLGKLVPPGDNKFAGLNSTVFSGGSFVYVPANTKVDFPLQAYFRLNASGIGQFERTLIIAENGSFIHYVEGCTAPVYSLNSLHAGVVEVFVKRGARVLYTTIQNWSKNVYNLVTKRAEVEEEGVMEWVDCNLGSRLNMKYPSCFLKGKKARGKMLSITYAGKGQKQDVGGKMIHLASETSSLITSKSVSQNGGRSSYRGLIYVPSGIRHVKSRVECHGLILDEKSRSDSYPLMKINSSGVEIEHEAMVSRIKEEQLFYLMSRGIKEAEACALIVNGFIEPVVKELPTEYAVEMNRLIQLSTKGDLG